MVPKKTFYKVSDEGLRSETFLFVWGIEFRVCYLGFRVLKP